MSARRPDRKQQPDALRAYRSKRRFAHTPEPAGEADVGGPRYLIQKHAARRLHYDLRLEHGGVLLSWAIPKGPSLDPAEKRLAVRTEDHPLEYGDFEGVIPRGEYGGGTVMLWDRGRWSANEDFDAGLREGRLKFKLFGAKLRGSWTLVRIKPKLGESDNQWLFIKERDGQTRSESEYAVTDEEPFSVVTQRSMREIAAAADRIWSTVSAPANPARRHRGRAGSVAQLHPEGLSGAVAAPLLGSLAAPQFRQTSSAPTGGAWLHELPLAGRRCLCTLRVDEVALRDEHGADLTNSFPEIARAAAQLPVDTAVLDGVVIAPTVSGVGDRAALEGALRSKQTAPLLYILFDLPYLQAYDLRRAPLSERKALLERLLLRSRSARLRLHEHLTGDADVILQHGRALGMPGLWSRRATSPYSARSGWLHITSAAEPEAAIGAAPQAVSAPRGRKPRKAVQTPAREARLADTASPGLAATPSPPRGRAAAAVTLSVSDGGAEVAGVRISNPQRVLYPEEGVTKLDLVRFYNEIGDWALPHLRGRPLSLYRCPEGCEKECFFQKHMSGMSIAHIREAPVREGEGKEPYVAIDDLAGLVTLAQLATLEIHPWGCREDDVERPDRMIFDLDPGPDVSWRQIVDVALTLRGLLAELGLSGFVKTSGGAGLHVVTPLVRRSDWATVKRVSQGIALRLAADSPKRVTASIAKWARAGRVFVDYLRNVRGATCVAAFSTRARPGAAVSTPLHWDELGPHPPVYTVQTLPRRLESLAADPWEGFFSLRQALTQAMLRRVSDMARERSAPRRG